MITVLHDDCRRALPSLEAGRFRTCVTSVPYWEQREYLKRDDPSKALEIGHEHTPLDYVKAIVEVFRDVHRVLADDGTLWVNVGDKYSADGGRRSGGGAFGSHNRLVDEGRIPHKLPRTRTPGVPPKNLLGIPWRLAFALQDDGWLLRSEIIWHKPDAKPSSIVDRPTTAHEHVFLFCKREVYFYNADAIREPQGPAKKRGRKVGLSPRDRGNLSDTGWKLNPLGRNARPVWTIATSQGDGVHAAPMPRALARKCVLAGSALGDHVLDPFGGTGTVVSVAEEEGRHGTMIDLDPLAIDCANKSTAQTGLFATWTRPS